MSFDLSDLSGLFGLLALMPRSSGAVLNAAGDPFKNLITAFIFVCSFITSSYFPLLNLSYNSTKSSGTTFAVPDTCPSTPMTKEEKKSLSSPFIAIKVLLDVCLS